MSRADDKEAMWRTAAHSVPRMRRCVDSTLNFFPSDVPAIRLSGVSAAFNLVG